NRGRWSRVPNPSGTIRSALERIEPWGGERVRADDGRKLVVGHDGTRRISRTRFRKQKRRRLALVATPRIRDAGAARGSLCGRVRDEGLERGCRDPRFDPIAFRLYSGGKPGGVLVARPVSRVAAR